MTYSLTWDLESIFPGGSQSPQLQTRMTQLTEEIAELTNLIQQLDLTSPDASAQLTVVLTKMTNVSNGLSQCSTFVEALTSQNVNDRQAKLLGGQLALLYPQFQGATVPLALKYAACPDEQWQQLLADPRLATIAFRLNEERRDGQDSLPEAQENIINQLALDGQSAWSEHYDTIVSSIEIPFTKEDGTRVNLSAGQAYNKMMGDPDPAIRADLFAKWETAWSKPTELFADTLNHLDGFRLTDYKLHGITDFMKQPLQDNRMSKTTLAAMWQTISANKQPFVDYLNRKAALMGKEKLDWQDQDAPVIVGDFKERTFTFDEAAAFIIQHFGEFSPKMASFAKSAFEKCWIEAEDRPGKRPGGYCAGLPETKESRIFMTYGNAIGEVATLAHELGHAFHSSVMWDLPSMNQDYAMNVAETASTFAELIVADANLQGATTPEEKINLLDIKMQNAIAMFMNIHARFLFEQDFYTARQKGLVASAEITEKMLTAQKEAYCDCLGSWHPYFWSAKLHFFIDDVPFYNFPYTFGYLFSLGIYAKAQATGTGFEDQYIALLRDTAAMTTEELAQKHLDVDLTQPDFWQAGIDVLKKDIDEFMTLTEAFLPA